MNGQQWEKLIFFKENLGLRLYPVADFAGNLMNNMMALVGLQRQSELERCAHYIKGRIVHFRESRDGQCLLVTEENGIYVHDPRYASAPSISAPGVLIDLTS